MGLPIVVILLSMAAVLLIATRRGFIRSETLHDAANIAAIVAFLAAVLVFVVPAASPKLNETTSTKVPTTTVAKVAITATVPVATKNQPTQNDVSTLPLPTMPVVMPSPNPTLTLGQVYPFNVGDYFIYESKGRSSIMWNERKEVTGTELVDGHMTWIISTTFENMSPSFTESIAEARQTEWVDQDNGVVIRYSEYTAYAKPASYEWDNQPLDVIKSSRLITYNLDNSSVETTWTVTDIAGQEHISSQSYSSRPDIYRVTRNLNVNDWYPWEISDNGPQVIKEETVKVAAGAFDCWVIKTTEHEDHQYYLYYFDQATGILVKYENWYNNAATWEILEQRNLLSFRL